MYSPGRDVVQFSELGDFNIRFFTSNDSVEHTGTVSFTKCDSLFDDMVLIEGQLLTEI